MSERVMLDRIPFVTLDDGRDVFLHPGPYGAKKVSFSSLGGPFLGEVAKEASKEWSAETLTGVGVWEELTGRNWRTQRAAVEALIAYLERDR